MCVNDVYCVCVCCVCVCGVVLCCVVCVGVICIECVCGWRRRSGRKEGADTELKTTTPHVNVGNIGVLGLALPCRWET